MILLKNGCSYSGLNVTPKNWNSSNAPLKRKWFISYRYYSSEFKKGKLKIIKGGINHLKTLYERRETVKALLKIEKDLVERQGYNPILNEVITENTDYIIAPDCGFNRALKLAYDRLEYEETTMSDLRSVIKGVSEAATRLQLSHKPINEIKRRNILSILDNCSEHIAHWSAKRYNKYKAYLSILFKELLNVEAIEGNPVRDIEKKTTIKTMREVLTQEERKKINKYLMENYFNFWRFLQIFFHSGARETELMKLKKEKVFINDQYYIVTVMKRGQPTEVKKPIKDSVKKLWEEISNEAKVGQFLFSKNLCPGADSISPRQITRRWKTHVKDKLKITADFYSLKHLNLDEVSEILSLEAASKMASHLSTKTTEGSYTIGKSERDLKQLRGLNNSFA
ncbi:MAG TPA: hypothetical protein VMU83_10225 [Hanamia sp.]|nr:hypothetical protein [Hanamia sp.]